MASSLIQASSRLSRLLGGPIGGLVATAIAFQAAPSWAQRAQDYTPSQFISILNGLGYPVELTDSIESANVQQAIRDFQLQYNLPVTGRVTPASQDIAAAIVQNLQQSLNRALRPTQSLPENQFYGSQTETMIKQFQDQNRLPMTGIATLETRRRLSESIATIQSAHSEIRANPLKSVAEPSSPIMLPKKGVLFGNIYTEPEFRRILQGLGYDIAPQKFISDPSATIAIQDFQRIYGLAITGTADQPTQETAKTILRVLQYNLRATVDKNLLTTEFYDPQTVAAVQEFQRQNRLQVDGIATISIRQRIDTVAKRMLKKG